MYRNEHFLEFLCFTHSEYRILADSCLISDIRIVDCFVSVFMVNLRTFSVPLTVQLEMVRRLLNNDLEKTWKQAGDRRNYEEPLNRIAGSGRGAGGGAKFETWTSIMRDRRVRVIMHTNGWLTGRFFFDNVVSQNSGQCPQNLTGIVLAFFNISLLLMKITLLISSSRTLNP